MYIFAKKGSTLRDVDRVLELMGTCVRACLCEREKLFC